MATVNEVYQLLDRAAPFETQMSFDNAGFLVGHGERKVEKILVSLDITLEVIGEAEEWGAQLIVSHHPVIFFPVKRITDDDPVGRKLLALTEAESKLETAVQGRYGEAFSDALAACRRSIGNYQELLEMLRENAQLSGKDPEALRAGVQKSHGLLAEFQVQEEAVQMLVSMTGKQKAAVRYYTGTGYSLINPYLRGRSKTLDPQARQQMEELHSLLEHQRVRKPITVYRGISHDTPMVTGSARGLNRYSDEELCGKLLVDGAFVSTSLREDSAFSGTMLVLELPIGVRGAYVGDISTLKHQEREFLMDMGQAFRVTGVERKNGKRYVYAKAIRT